MAPCGLLKEGTDPVEGIYCGDPDTTRFPFPDHVVHFPGIPKDNMHLNLVEEATTSDWINAFADNKGAPLTPQPAAVTPLRAY